MQTGFPYHTLHNAVSLQLQVHRLGYKLDPHYQVQRHLCLPLRIGLRLADCTLRINPISSERSHRRRCNPAACWNIQADCQHPDHQEWHGCFTDHTSILPGREGRSRWRSSAGVSKCCFHPSSTIHTNQVQSNIPNSTPYGPDQSPPNKERGILHIEKIQPLEILQPRVRQPSISIMIHPNRSATRLNNPRRLTNGPYGIYARDALHNTYSRLTTHSNYETGFQSKGSSANKHRPVPRLPRQPRPAQKTAKSADGFACKGGSGEGNVLRNAPVVG